MPISIGWTEIVNMAGIVNGFFLAFVVLGTRKGNRAAKQLLAALMLALVGVTVAGLLWSMNFYYTFPQFVGIFPLVYFALGPLLYLYTRALISPGFKFEPKHLLHFLPLAVFVLLRFPLFLESPAAKLAYFTGQLENPGLGFHINLICRFTHQFIYLAWVAVILREHTRGIRETHSNIEKIKLRWLFYLVFAFTSVLIAYIIFYFLWINRESGTVQLGRLVSIWQTVMVFWLGYKGLVQPDIFPGQHAKPEPAKYRGSTMTNRQADRYEKTLVDYMNDEKPYTRLELTLNELAEETGIPSRHLSQLINERLDKNFYEFVNRYRVEEAQRLLLGPKADAVTITAIAFEAGFNSKSAFYHFFKNITGMTPTQFKKKK